MGHATGRRWEWMLTLVAAILLGGCAALGDHHASPVSEPPLAATDQPVLLGPGDANSLVTDPVEILEIESTSAREEGSPSPSTTTTASDGARDEGDEGEFRDPFQTPGDALDGVEEYDPWERFNVAMFTFNRKMDHYLLKPVATFYDRIMPDEIERSIVRGFHNIRFVTRFFNNLFQGKFKGAGIELSRFLINSTFGLGGMLDFAQEVFGLETPDEDSGQTLGFYGMKPGPYIQLPFIQPLTLRDGVGYALDIVLDPVNYFLPFGTLFGIRSGDVLNERSVNLETFQGVEDATVDLYGAVRNAYLQKRVRAIRE